jgi:hypothetical protein
MNHVRMSPAAATGEHEDRPYGARLYALDYTLSPIRKGILKTRRLVLLG